MARFAVPDHGRESGFQQFHKPGRIRDLSGHIVVALVGFRVLAPLFGLPVLVELAGGSGFGMIPSISLGVMRAV